MEAALLALITLISGSGAFVGRWMIKRLDKLETEIRELQAKNLLLVEERNQLELKIAHLEATIANLEDARKERDSLRTEIAALRIERDRLKEQLAELERQHPATA